MLPVIGQNPFYTPVLIDREICATAARVRACERAEIITIVRCRCSWSNRKAVLFSRVTGAPPCYFTKVAGLFVGVFSFRGEAMLDFVLSRAQFVRSIPLPK